MIHKRRKVFSTRHEHACCKYLKGYVFKEKIVTKQRSGERSSRQMPIVKLFNGEEVAGDIIEDRDSELILVNSSDFISPKRVILKRDIFSIDF